MFLVKGVPLNIKSYLRKGVADAVEDLRDAALAWRERKNHDLSGYRKI